MKCSNCGAQLEPNARFCATCGTEQTQLSSPESAPASGASPSSTPPGFPPSPTSSPYGSNPTPPTYGSAPPPSYGSPPPSPGYSQYAASPYPSYSTPTPARDTGFKNLFSFSGRIGRGEWWGITVGLIVVYIVAALLAQTENVIAILITIVLYIVAVWISLATSVKRWHDRNKSGWWILIGFIPLIGGIWALIEQGFLSGTDGPNSYGTSGDGSAFG